ncbi:hypothetical protein SUGI_0757750 [Cryptomeria japonica]|nr:hypothetical protein SUGI_0757750 [Cryptomeria japonica]
MTLELVCRVARKPGITLVLMACGTLVYYHCAILQTTLVSLICDVLLVILCSFAVLGLMFRHLTVSVPVDPLEWQVSQETASGVAEFMANTIGAAASVLRVAASGRDNKLFFKVPALHSFLFPFFELNCILRLAEINNENILRLF